MDEISEEHLLQIAVAAPIYAGAAGGFLAASVQPVARRELATHAFDLAEDFWEVAKQKFGAEGGPKQ